MVVVQFGKGVVTLVTFEGLRLEEGMPIYLQIIRYLERGIAAGTVRDGDELPSRRVLSARLGVNPNTIQKAFRALEDAGVITSWAGFSRVVRTETLRIREQSYMEGLRSLGAGHGRLLLRHVVPNLLPNIVVLFTTRVGRCVLSIASLSYLGLGLQTKMPDWSVMISDARLNYRSASHLIIVPGVCIFLLLLAINLLGDALRDQLDVRDREVKEL